MENTSGLAPLQLRTVERVRWLEAYRSLHNSLGQQPDMVLAELWCKVNRPMQARKDGNIARCNEELQEAMMEFSRYPRPFKYLPGA